MSAALLLAQLFHRAPLVDVVSGSTPADVGLVYPLLHVVFAPLTLPADWLNGGSRHDIIGFVLWALLLFALVRLGRQVEPAPDATAAIRAVREAARWAILILALGGFIAWAAFLPRPIPRLVARDPELLVFDVHSHTTLSHDGRPGFGIAANAAWHERAGFDAAFITDHNRWDGQTDRQTDGRGSATRSLSGDELSLYGLHLIVLGNTREIDNRGYNGNWDSTGVLIRELAAGGRATTPDTLPPTPYTPFLIASLPEYWRKHWGAELGELVGWGVEGFEIWTTSPRAMDFPPGHRSAVLARARLSGLTLFGATDMHGYGNAATVWNVARLPGWRAMNDSVLTVALLAAFRARGVEANRVLAIRRWIPGSRLCQAVASPVNVAGLLLTASVAHAAALLGWIWLVAMLLKKERL